MLRKQLLNSEHQSQNKRERKSGNEVGQRFFWILFKSEWIPAEEFHTSRIRSITKQPIAYPKAMASKRVPFKSPLQYC